MTEHIKSNPWLSIWTKPRATIRTIVDTKPSRSFFWIATIYGLQTLLYMGNLFSMGTNYSFVAILIACIILAPIFGTISIYIYSWLFFLGGRLLKGTAPFLHIRTALSWSFVPVIVNLIFWIFLLIYSFSHIFIKYESGLPLILMNLVMVITGIWSLVLLIQCNREVQSFSVGRSIASIILGYIIGFVISFIVTFVVLLLVGIQKS